MLALQNLLANPEEPFFVNTEACALYTTDKPKYEERVTKQAKKAAKGAVADWDQIKDRGNFGMPVASCMSKGKAEEEKLELRVEPCRESHKK